MSVGGMLAWVLRLILVRKMRNEVDSSENKRKRSGFVDGRNEESRSFELIKELP